MFVREKRINGYSYLYTNVWPAPAARGLFELSAQSASTYPVSGMLPGQDGDLRGPILISPAASSAIGLSSQPAPMARHYG
jgi:hypothetical protein